MEFKLITDRPDLFSSFYGRSLWRNDDESCMIATYDTFHGSRRHGRTIQFCVGRPVYAWLDSKLCAYDGVDAFIVKDLMAIAMKHGCEGDVMDCIAAVRFFFTLLGNRPNLAAYHEYKENKRGYRGVH